MIYNGLDLSNIQGSNFSWQQIIDSGNSFVICKNGNGNSGFDSMYAKNIASAKSVGLTVGAYNVVYPLPTITTQPLRDPIKQAIYHFSTTGKDIVPSIDLEWPIPQDFSKWGCSAQQIAEWTIAYLQEYESISGIRPLVYSYPSFLQTLNLPRSFADKYKLWIASYTTVPDVPKPWLPTEYVLWQNSGGATTKLSNGVAVDTNVCKDLTIFDVPANTTVQPTVILAPRPSAIEINTTMLQPVLAAPIIQPVQINSVINKVESTLTNNPGILTTIQNFIIKIIKSLLSIK